ncbi:redox-regulated ATPase YchF, partial [Patescibacteria group bacterium]|nr:redox-regulated ATPase YchF [Patescibacteria group bacterium]
KRQIADTTNYPFCTIEPNVGVVEVPDGRLPVLAQIVKTEEIIPAVVEFVDIAGLVQGASKGEGLGNKFLANIRETAVIAHVVRFFCDENVLHVKGAKGPVDDVEIVHSELILADLQTLANQKEPRLSAVPEEKKRWAVTKKLERELDKGHLARQVNLDNEERELIKDLFLLTSKPMIFVANFDETQLGKVEKALVDFRYQPVIGFSAQLESQLAEFAEEERAEYLAGFGLEKSGLDRLIASAYDQLGLISFLTAGQKEVRAWAIKKGATALEAAGTIHTDFADHFIKAAVVSFEDFVQYQGWEGAKLVGKVRLEGREYQMRDGDVVDFKVNV